MNDKNCPLSFTLSSPAEITSRSSFIYLNISSKDCVGSQQLRSAGGTNVLIVVPGGQLLLLQSVNVSLLHGGARPTQTRSHCQAADALSDET